jgi:hypothetical protein
LLHAQPLFRCSFSILGSPRFQLGRCCGLWDKLLACSVNLLGKYRPWLPSNNDTTHPNVGTWWGDCLQPRWLPTTQSCRRAIGATFRARATTVPANRCHPRGRCRHHRHRDRRRRRRRRRRHQLHLAMAVALNCRGGTFPETTLATRRQPVLLTAATLAKRWTDVLGFLGRTLQTPARSRAK